MVGAAMRGGRAAHAVGVAAVCLGLAAGCTAADSVKEPSSSTSSGAGSQTGSATETSAPSPSTPAFGSDVTMPSDGVGTARLTSVDAWTLSNEIDNVHAGLVAPPGATGLALAEQQVVETWLSQFRENRASRSPSQTGSATAAPTTTDPAAEPTTEPTEAEATDPATATATATAGEAATGPATAGPDSLRVVSQLLAARPSVSGVRLYAQSTIEGTTTQAWRTFWFDPAAGKVVSGADLFAAPTGGGDDPLGAARKLVSGAGGDVGAVSDRDLFATAAFTTKGDLLLYLPGGDGMVRDLTLAKKDIDPLLSPLGKQAQIAAADAVLMPAGSAASTPAATSAATAPPSSTSSPSSATSSMPSTSNSSAPSSTASTPPSASATS